MVMHPHRPGSLWPGSKNSGLKNLRYTVLGFGDRQFPNFCQFALSVDAALAGKGVSRLHAIELIDRCSASQFSEWGNRVGEVIGTPLFLNYCALQPATVKLELVERADYGIAVQAPTSIFRFKPAEQGGWLTASPRRFKALPPFEAGDLLGLFPHTVNPAVLLARVLGK
jgi:sulfite reductase (NADPH) flavoprotein alpha-component